MGPERRGRIWWVQLKLQLGSSMFPSENLRNTVGNRATADLACTHTVESAGGLFHTHLALLPQLESRAQDIRGYL